MGKCASTTFFIQKCPFGTQLRTIGNQKRLRKHHVRHCVLCHQPPQREVLVLWHFLVPAVCCAAALQITCYIALQAIARSCLQPRRVVQKRVLRPLEVSPCLVQLDSEHQASSTFPSRLSTSDISKEVALLWQLQGFGTPSASRHWCRGRSWQRRKAAVRGHWLDLIPLRDGMRCSGGRRGQQTSWRHLLPATLSELTKGLGAATLTGDGHHQLARLYRGWAILKTWLPPR